ncbi:F-box protein FBW2-like isoform X2 [Prunus avium]|uniref:F-box protein FBW2-like isoform X2 n=1 Tax=Prunus avium TaxID=42229 RepID=A0A6P5SBV7_PRUAV|nr:F-box protein FBW2-like isoform X2 [Prunus avium]XP_021811875.1 F-box protein FBW2-like isoform X2 [Prunus avium]XP_021811876.1 F-box protein FBW2-like isoform X2 [Prunus avium]XP_021811877.1 F-box protein FBW2-like isoform X2 [Prunus avium]XP_021811878.1 F-box protein FBW2-like isoform X2 [Prunus avium]XP_021811879.1 F-box protein FBW2-like isoform X2 [Prunus avium]XP_021811880.1 F-box protein FBW2-like isoform X2 [Prunus avium]XP_021811882.1 F-box protein FBW2-like isoform X2 [Prunus av
MAGLRNRLLGEVFEKVGMESVLLDVPFVCKSWYKATLNPSCWQCLIFPDNERTEVWPWDDFECPNFQNLMDRFASEFQIDGDRFSVTTFLKFVINRSTGTAVLLKLPKCCTVETFEFAANVCPGLVTLSLPLKLLMNSDNTNLELIGKWKNLEVLSLGSWSNLATILAIIQTHCKNFYGLDLSKGYVDEHHALSIVKLVPNITYLNLKGAKVNHDSLVTLLRGCKDLVMLDARDCFGFDENDDEISKLASHISKFMCEGSENPFRDLPTNLVWDDGYSFQEHVEENWDEMLNDLNDAFND